MKRAVARSGVKRLATSAVALAGVVALVAPHAQASETQAEIVAPGSSASLSQSVEIPFIPPKPDIVLVIDRTGSMGPAITDVKSKIANLVATIQTTEPDAQFAVVAYCDTGEATPAVSTLSNLSGNAAAVIDAVIDMPLCYGGDLPESQLDALTRIGFGSAVNFRPDSNRLIAWFGDAPGHLRGPSVDATIRALKQAEATVVAVSVGKNQLNSGGQASRITKATGGTLLSGVSTDNVAASLLQGLTSLPVDITAKAECEDGLTVDIAKPTRTVPSGESTTFDQIVTVAADAAPGSELSCEVRFWIDGDRMGEDWIQKINVTVAAGTPAVTEPSVEPSQPAVSESPEAEPSEAPTQETSPEPSNKPEPAPAPSETQEPAEQVVPEDHVVPAPDTTPSP